MEKKQGMRQPPRGGEQKDNPLAKLFGGGKKEPYVSITKSIADAGIDAKIMNINIDDVVTECVVIPVQEMIYKEWRLMSGSELVNASQNERNNNDQGSAEVGGSSDVPGGAD